MTDTIRIEITEQKHLRTVWALYGAVNVMKEIEDANKQHGRLPGLGMALLIAEREVADLRANMAGEALRAVQRAGYDICRYTEVRTAWDRDGTPYLELKEPDLVDRTEQP